MKNDSLLLPRHLAEKLLDGAASMGWSIADDLRQILAAPVVECQPALWVHPAHLKRDDGWTPLAIDATINQIAPLQIPLYTAPLELAELQATIARLTADNDRLRIVTKFDEAVACVFDFAKMVAANTGCREWDEQLERFAEDVIDFSPEYKRQWLDIVKTCIERDAYKAELERLKNGQGEPVLWLVRIPDEPQNSDESPAVYVYADSPLELNILLKKQGATVEKRYYASPAASVSVALSNLPIDWRTKFEEDQDSNEGGIASFSPDSYMQDEINELRACLDKVKELNQ